MALLLVFRHLSSRPLRIVPYRRILSTHMSSMSACLVQSKGNLNGDRSNLIPFSSRLHGGRALAQDVWSIYKYESCQIIIRSEFIDFP